MYSYICTVVSTIPCLTLYTSIYMYIPTVESSYMLAVQLYSLQRLDYCNTTQLLSIRLRLYVVSSVGHKQCMCVRNLGNLPSSRASSTTVVSHAGEYGGHGDCCSGTGRGVHLYESEARKSALGGLLAHLAISCRGGRPFRLAIQNVVTRSYSS